MENKQVFTWDDEILDVEQEYTLLPEGDYFFKVTNFERAMYPGGAKLPACPKAVVNFDIYNGVKVANHLHQDFLLCQDVAWKISQFFKSIGEKKKGERIQMKWNIVNGAIGKCHITSKSYVNKYGENKTINTIDRFLPYDEEAVQKFKGDINAEEAKDILDDDLPF